jgi:uncharacterized protein YjbI with pentapeptide repeats
MGAPTDTRCSFTFDPAEWKTDTGVSSPLLGDLDELWKCPHEAGEEFDYCLFHRPVERKDPEAVRNAFLDKIDEPGDEPKQFVGARFGRLNLDHEIVECRDNHMIDLRHARFEDSASWQYTIVEQPISFSGAEFLSRPEFTETVFNGEVYCHKVNFEEPVRFIETEFRAGLWGNGAEFTEVNFHNAKFGGPVDLSEASFQKAHFRAVQFETTAKFKLATFDHVSFTGTRFNERFYFDQATVPEKVSLQKTKVDELASFEDLNLAAETCCIDLTQSIIPAGRLALPEEGTLVYDLTDATLGDVDLATDDPPPDLIERYRFAYTTFQGFDFGVYRDALHQVNWRLHTVIDVPELDPRAYPPAASDRESTYLKAKNGANAIGDTKAAAEFFRREMLARRDQYVLSAKDWSEGLRTQATAVGRWSANTLLNLTAGYGERPSRVIVVSVGTIIGFAGIFAILQSAPLYDTPVGYLVLSLQSFITLVLGGAEDAGGPWIRLLAQIEGFIGAFLIALFVFTLTRSIHR